MLFHDKDTLDLIKVLATDVLDSNDDKIKAIACFDLGEFARFFPYGREYLESLKLKEKISYLMSSNSSADLKKEAITCY